MTERWELQGHKGPITFVLVGSGILKRDGQKDVHFVATRQEGDPMMFAFPMEEFHDGRFKPLGPTPSPGEEVPGG